MSRFFQCKAYPRAALIGNPSDGFFGKTIAFVFKNFEAELTLQPSEHLAIIPGELDRLVFKNSSDLVNTSSQYGYYGAVRLLKASICVFQKYAKQQGIAMDDKNFEWTYRSNIPNRLGMAGSSAIITAAFRTLMSYYELQIEKPVLANLILSVEKEELNIGAGLQDRVAQVYETPVYMDFNRSLMEEQGYGTYIPFSKKLLPRLYIAYRQTLSEGSEVTHNDLAKRFAAGEPGLNAAVEQWKQLTDEVWTRLQSGRQDIGDLLNQNYDLRASVCAIAPGNKAMIEQARKAGVSAKFTGSGGAIIGTYETEAQLDALAKDMKSLGAVVIKPEVAGDE